MGNDLQKWELERDRYKIEKIKIVLTLSSGSLIVSLGILSAKICLRYKGVLYISWIFLICAIFFGIWAITVGESRYDRAVKGKKGKLKDKEKSLYEKGKVLFSYEAETPGLQIYAFAIGLISFFLFVFLNIDHILIW